MTVNFNILNQLGSPAINSNTLANRPAPGYVGRLFVSIDTFALYRDNGTGWDLIGGPGTGTVTGSGVATRVTFWDGTSSISSSANLYWDNTNSRLGIKTNTPGVELDVHGTGTIAQFNGTGTSNSYLAFQQAGTSQYSVGYDYNAGTRQHFRIYDNVGAKNVLGILQSSRFVGINYQFTGASDVPRYTFDVFGNVGATGTFDFGADTITRLTSTATRIKTSYNGFERGISLDFLNEIYTFAVFDYGLKIDNNIGQINLGDYLGAFGSYNYLKIDSSIGLIATYFDANNVGLRIDTAANNYFLGSNGNQGNYANIQLVCPDATTAYYYFYNTVGDADGLVVNFQTGNNLVQLGFTNSGNNTALIIEDSTQIIRTFGGGQNYGLELNFNNLHFKLGDYNLIGSSVYFDADNDNGFAMIYSGGYANFRGDSSNTYIGDVNTVGNGTYIAINDVAQTIFGSNNLKSATAGGASGQHLKIRLGGVDYKIALLNP